MNESADKNIKYSIDGKVFVIEINRPEKKNALLPGMYTALAAGLHQANEDGDLPLHLACGNETSAAAGIVQLVMDAAPEALKQPGLDAYLPLHCACHHSGSLDAVRSALEAV